MGECEEVALVTVPPLQRGSGRILWGPHPRFTRRLLISRKGRFGPARLRLATGPTRRRENLLQLAEHQVVEIGDIVTLARRWRRSPTAVITAALQPVASHRRLQVLSLPFTQIQRLPMQQRNSQSIQ